jgi:hypothetical protein
MKKSVCRHCFVEFDLDSQPKGWMANHSRWCDKNPIKYKSSGQLNTPEAIEKRTKKIVQRHAEGVYDYKKLISSGGRKSWKIDTIEKLRTSALSSKHRRLRRKMIEYNGVMLDSTWELALAIRLDQLGIKWVRPDPIEWVDECGIIHNYFPDFYLTDHDIFLDPKNPIAYRVQEKKINCLKDQIKNLVFLTSLDECKNFAPMVKGIS